MGVTAAGMAVAGGALMASEDCIHAPSYDWDFHGPLNSFDAAR